MKRSAGWVIMLGLVVALGGCAAGASSGRAPQADDESGIPEDSPFAQIREGMSKEEVMEVLGMPTTRTNLGEDDGMPGEFAPERWSYRGKGRIYFSGVGETQMADPEVNKIEYDPNERAADPPPPKPYGENY